MPPELSRRLTSDKGLKERYEYIVVPRHVTHVHAMNAAYPFFKHSLLLHALFPWHSECRETVAPYRSKSINAYFCYLDWKWNAIEPIVEQKLVTQMAGYRVSRSGHQIAFCSKVRLVDSAHIIRCSCKSIKVVAKSGDSTQDKTLYPQR